ncbi:peptidoglycan-binding domain-containing protein [Ilumatobacter nonamiensis]|uniref:peptidoglycan-binding domain-containing protein n=1 Tax=Ilumatobacter nonamiensis TaxID=467093 RepID=UPI00034A44D0|nr:peptidoglycan-binding domain-containing protein [Ilumatobacter nonamiensis]
MSDDDINLDPATSSDDPEGGDTEPSATLPDWSAAVLRGGATIVAAGIVLALALALTAPDESSSTDSPSTSATAALETVTTIASPPVSSLVGPTTAAPTSSAPTTEPPPPTAPTDPRCPSYDVTDALPVQLCDEGDLVIEVQTALTETGFPIGVDGFFTSTTEDAVIEFQAREGLEQDGVVGPQTASALGIG